MLQKIALALGIEKQAYSLLIQFYNFYGFKCKKQLSLLLFGAVISGVIEILGLILLYVLIRLMIDFKGFAENHTLVKIFSFFHLEDPNIIIPIFGGFILSIFVFKNVYLMFYYLLQHKILKQWKFEISSNLMERYIKAPYTFLLSYNSATIIRNVNSTVTTALNGFVLSALNYFANLIAGLIVLSLLCLRYLEVTLLIAFILAISTVIQNKFLRKKQQDLGRLKEELASEQTKSVYQGIHAVKETKVSGKEKYFLDIFKHINKTAIDTESKALFYTRLPAHTTEIVIVISIIIITVSVLMDTAGNLALSLSSLGVLGAIAFRLAPIMNRLISAMQAMNKNNHSMKLLFAEIEKLKNLTLDFADRSEVVPLPFDQTIKFDKVRFRYPRAKVDALKSIDLKIQKGEFIGILGESGAGKTTLVDIFLGLLSPTRGSVSIDDIELTMENNQGWQKNLAYVPQSIYLSDSSIAENIAFGVEKNKIDRSRVLECVEATMLKPFVESKKEGIDFIVGENGKRLSGGQKQRIGIARALYSGAEVLVLDEATAALDVPTEVEITKAINNIREKKTILVIAHRLSTIIDADRLVFLKNGEIEGIGRFDELYNNSPEFNKIAKLAKINPSSEIL